MFDRHHFIFYKTAVLDTFPTETLTKRTSYRSGVCSRTTAARNRNSDRYWWIDALQIREKMLLNTPGHTKLYGFRWMVVLWQHVQFIPEGIIYWIIENLMVLTYQTKSMFVWGIFWLSLKDIPPHTSQNCMWPERQNPGKIKNLV